MGMESGSEALDQAADSRPLPQESEAKADELDLPVGFVGLTFIEGALDPELDPILTKWKRIGEAPLQEGSIIPGMPDTVVANPRDVDRIFLAGAGDDLGFVNLKDSVPDALFMNILGRAGHIHALRQQYSLMLKHRECEIMTTRDGAIAEMPTRSIGFGYSVSRSSFPLAHELVGGEGMQAAVQDVVARYPHRTVIGPNGAVVAEIIDAQRTSVTDYAAVLGDCARLTEVVLENGRPEERGYAAIPHVATQAVTRFVQYASPYMQRLVVEQTRTSIVRTLHPTPVAIATQNVTNAAVNTNGLSPSAFATALTRSAGDSSSGSDVFGVAAMMFAQAEIVLKDLPSVVGVEASIAAAIGTMLTLMIVPRARTPTETLYQGLVFVCELLGQIGRVDWGNGAAAATPLMRLLGADSNFTTNGAPSVEYLGPQSRPRFIDSIRAGSLAADFRDLSAATVTLLENLYDILARSGITWTVRAGAALPDGRRLYDHVVDEIQYGRGLAQSDLADDVTEMIRLIAGTLNNLMQNRGGPIHGLMGSLAGRGSKIARSVFDMYAAAAGANVLYTANPETEDVVDRFNFFASTVRLRSSSLPLYRIGAAAPAALDAVRTMRSFSIPIDRLAAMPLLTTDITIKTPGKLGFMDIDESRRMISGQADMLLHGVAALRR